MKLYFYKYIKLKKTHLDELILIKQTNYDNSFFLRITNQKIMNKTATYFFFFENEFKFFKKIFFKKSKFSSFFRLENKRLFERFIKLFLTKGLYFRYFLVFSKILSMHKFYFINFYGAWDKTYKSYKIFFDYAERNLNFFSLEHVLEYIISNVDSLLDISVVKVNKKGKKKKSEPYDLKLKYVPIHKRYKFVFNALFENTKYFNKYTLPCKIYASIMETYLDVNTSMPNKKKLSIYKFALKLYKNKKKTGIII